MLDFLRNELQFILIVTVWVLSTVFAGPVIYALLPLSVFLFYRRESFGDILFGFILILVLSDMTPDVFSMRKIKTAKYAYIIALSLILLVEQHRFAPLSVSSRSSCPSSHMPSFPWSSATTPSRAFRRP